MYIDVENLINQPLVAAYNTEVLANLQSYL